MSQWSRTKQEGHVLRMSWSNEDERRVGIALREARDRLELAEGEPPTGAEIVFEVVKQVVDIERAA